MPLLPGAQLGPYRIESAIGAGGMGEVWKARDTRLDRIVAIKTINGPFSERFEREARAISALNHPHICALYDVGRLRVSDASASQGAEVDYLVMEFVEGAPIKGPLPLDQALKYAAQICDALDAAHRKGIVHRDLKPDNILLTKAGVKLLDFGLAKDVGPAHRLRQGSGGQEAGPYVPTGDGPTGDGPTGDGPTGDGHSNDVRRVRLQADLQAELAATKALTGAHVILGTPQYMAPEQIEGRDADARTDLFAFGCVLYELLTGQKAFEGKTPSSTMAAILATEPRPIRDVQPVTPPALERIVKRCLAKDPDNRWQTARDLTAELQWIATEPATHSATANGAKPGRKWLAWAVAMLFGLAFIGLAVAHFRETPATVRQSVRYEIPSPENAPIRDMKLSPDGLHLAFVVGEGPARRLWVRSLDSIEPQRLSDLDAIAPFWSPDSLFIAFFGQGRLQQVARSGGRPTPLCDPPPTTGTGPGDAVFSGGTTFFGGAVSQGGAWRADGVIVYSLNGPFFRCQTTSRSSIKLPDVIRGVAPEFLPDGRFLFNGREAGISIGSIDGSAPVRLLPDDSSAVYVPPSVLRSTGHLIFRRADALMAQPFDAERTALGGDSVRLADHVGDTGFLGIGAFSAAANGVLVYGPGLGGERELHWINRGGERLKAAVRPMQIAAPGLFNLSPDEKWLAVTIGPQSGRRELWLLDLERGPLSRFSSTGGPAVWSPDGHSVLLNRDGAWFLKPVDGSGAEQSIFKPASATGFIYDWSRDGKSIAYNERGKDGTTDIWFMAATAPERNATPFLSSPFNEAWLAFSPDSRWTAYTTDESGRDQVWVRSVEPGGRGRQISINGGQFPQWGRDGNELFYKEGSKMIAVRVRMTPTTIEADAPRTLFESPGIGRFRVSRDGRFLLTLPPDGASLVKPLTVVTNWQSGLKK